MASAIQIRLRLRRLTSSTYGKQFIDMERFEEIARGWDVTALPGDAIPASTAVLLRDSDAGVEVLMLRRNTKLAFVGGAWVFPGGRVDPEDVSASASPEPGEATDLSDSEADEPMLDPQLGTIEAAATAARRETMEEAGLDISDSALEPLSHWMPPAGTPRRFSTWFFVASAPAGEITIDGGEIHDHMWTTAEIALQRRDAGEVQLAPPTFVTLVSLNRFSTVAEALAALTSEPVEYFETRIIDDEGVMTALWHGDERYEESKADGETENGARHRLRMTADGWEYQRSE